MLHNPIKELYFESEFPHQYMENGTYRAVYFSSWHQSFKKVGAFTVN